MLVLSIQTCKTIYRYYVVHYISTSVHQIDLDLQLVLWKQLCVLLQKKDRKKWTKIQIFSLTTFSLSKAVHLTFSFSKYHLYVAKHAFIFSTHFFNGGLKLLFQNVSRDCLGFFGYLGICFEVSATHFTFQQWKQPEFGKPLSTERSFPLSIFLISLKFLVSEEISITWYW